MNEQDIQNAIAALEAQRGLLPDEVIQTSIDALRRQMTALSSSNYRALLYAALATNYNLTDSATTRSLRLLYDLQLRLKSIATEYSGVLSARSTYNVLATFDGAISSQVVGRALLAALAIRREMQTYSNERAGITPYVQIGIHFVTTAIDLDDFGRSEEPDLLILGALADAASPNQILTSYAAYREARGDFAIYYGKSIGVAGLSDTLRMYMVSGPRVEQVHHRSSIQRGLHTMMIGRRAELDYLQKTLRACMGERNRYVITVVGEAGMGKTRLLDEFQTWLDMIPEPVWYFKGQATASTRYQPYGLIRDMLIRRFEISPADTYSDAYHKLTQGIIELLGDEDNTRPHLISQLVGLEFSANTVSQSDNAFIRNEAVSALLQFFQSMFATYRDPVVIVIEQIQWADEASFLFLQQLLAESPQPMPMLVIMTARTTAEEVPPFWYQDAAFNQHTIVLDPLSTDLSTLLISEVLRNMVEIPQHLPESILGHTRGNPRYMLEMLQSLLDTEVIIEAAEGWKLDTVAFGDYNLVSMPQLVQARLNHLSPAAQELVMCAAIVGDIFWDKAVRHMAQLGDEEAYQHALDELQAAGIMFALDTSNFPSATEYQFSNGMLQRYLYEITPLSSRQLYHARYASWLIGQGMNRVAQYAGVIAQHYQSASDLPRAIKWHLLAARQAEQMFSPRTATHHYEQSLALARRQLDTFHDHYISALMGLSAIYAHQARYSDALVMLQEVLDMAGHSLQAALALVEMATIYNQLGHPRDALAKAHESVAIFTQLDEAQHPKLGTAWLNMSRAHRRLSNHSEAVIHAEKALAFAQGIKNETLVAATYNVLGTIYISSGQNPEMAMVYFNKALETARRQGNLELVASLSNNIAESARMRGDYQSALVMYRKTEEAAQRIGNQPIVISSIMNTGAAWLGLQKFGKAAEALQKALSLLVNQPESERYCESLWQYAAALIGLGQYSEAIDTLQQAYTLAVHLDQPAKIGAVWRTLGSWCAAADLPVEIHGEVYDAITCFRQSYDMLDRNDLLLDKAYTLQSWGHYLIDIGRTEEAVVLWKQAIDLMGRAGATYQQETMQGILDDLMQQNGQLGIEAE